MKWFIILHFVLNGHPLNQVVARVMPFDSEQQCLAAIPVAKKYISLKPNETVEMSCKQVK